MFQSILWHPIDMPLQRMMSVYNCSHSHSDPPILLYLSTLMKVLISELEVQIIDKVFNSLNTGWNFF